MNCLVPWQHQNCETVRVNLTRQHQSTALNVTPLGQYVGMQEGEVMRELNGEQLAHLNVVCFRYRHASLIEPQWPIEVVTALQSGNGIQNGNVSDVASVVLEQHIQPRQVLIEFRQTLRILWISPRQLGLECHLVIVVPDSVRNEQINPFGVLLHRDGVDFVPREVAHCPISLRHDQGLIPVVGGRAYHLVKSFGRTVATNLVDPGNV